MKKTRVNKFKSEQRNVRFTDEKRIVVGKPTLFKNVPITKHGRETLSSIAFATDKPRLQTVKPEVPSDAEKPGGLFCGC